MARWVNIPTFLGLDRRIHQGLRIFDRRRADMSSEAPSLPTMLRQLRLRAANITDDETFLAFRGSVAEVAKLARANGASKTANILSELEKHLEKSSDDAYRRDVIDGVLMRANEALSSAKWG